MIASRAEGQEQGRGIRLSTPSFISVRYASASSSSVYAVYTMGPAGVVLGMVLNPRTGYRELVGGLVSRAVWGRQSITIAVAGADAPESAYLQTYLLPSLVVGGVSVSATFELYHPLQHAGTGQLYLNPLAVVLRPASWIGVGGVYALGVSSGEGPGHRAGPTIEVDIPRGAVKVELLRHLHRPSNEVRMSVEAAF
jgi:hypothetical protein